MPEGDLIAQRRRKVDDLRALGVPAFNVDFHPDHTTEQAKAVVAEFEKQPAAANEDGPHLGPVVTIAGRVMQLRDQGKSVWAHVEDPEGRLQVWLRLDRLGESTFGIVQLLDLGDIVGVTGPVMRTRRGEPTVMADSITVLVKSLRPLPEKYHGLGDQETRYRQRYLDLVSNKEQRDHFAARTRIVRAIRRVLDERGYLEVETPILQTIAGGTTAKPFMTHWNALHIDVYLRIAIELHLKRLIVGGYRSVYEIGRIFRNEGLSPRHNPEFTMLEAYEAYSDYSGMRILTEELIVQAALAAGPPMVREGTDVPPYNDPLLRPYVGRVLNLRPPLRAARMVDLIAEVCGFDPVVAWDAGTLADEARRLDVEIDPNWAPGAVLFQIYESKVEHTLWDPIFVMDYPADVSPLARRRSDDPRFVERFELVVAGRELCNAFSELNDPIDQRQRFEDQQRRRESGDEEAHPFDADFVEAIEVGMPPTGGLGIGIDRLTMLLTDSPTIRDVLLFPTMRPRPAEEEEI